MITTELILATSVVLIVSCICSLLEAVLYSLTQSQIEMLAEQGRSSGKILKKLHEDIQRPISAILSLNTLANTGGAAIAGAAFVGAFGESKEAYFTGALALSVLIFSEVLPKTAGVVYARSLGPFIAHPILWLVWVFTPFIWLNRFATQLITRHADQAQNISAEEIKTIARMSSQQAGGIAPQQEQVISNILNLHNLRARDIMTPRTVVFSLDSGLRLADVRQEAGHWRHSRVPLYGDDKDQIVGLVLRRDVFAGLAADKDDTRLADLGRPPHAVPESARLDQLLQEFLQRREHLFIVIDEYGGFSGIVALEDVIEEIVGEEIVDELDSTADMQEHARRQGNRMRPPSSNQ
jgi:CBS domain containing-hemolysin-like protein